MRKNRTSPLTHAEIELSKAINQAKRAIAGDSNDAAYDALVALLTALGEDSPPECACEDRTDVHEATCPCLPWLRAGLTERGSPPLQR